MNNAVLAGSPAEKTDARQAQLRARYLAARGKKAAFVLGLCALLFALVLTGLSVGGAGFEVGESWRALFHGFWAQRGDMSVGQRIIWQLRVPRVLTAAVSGMGLAAAGLVMQTILRNPLASPYTLGISSAASFGAALSIVLGLNAARALPAFLPGSWIVAFNSFLCAGACTLAVYALSKTQRVSAETIVLFGVAANFLFSAATSFLQYIGSEEQLSELVYWMFGSLSKATWSKFYLVLAVTAAALVWMRCSAWNYNALLLGDEAAGSLGLSVERVRISGLLLASLVTAVIVSLLGPIGFIGLVAPHLGRILAGSDHRVLLPVSALLGACLLLAADVLSCVVLAPVVVPVGIVTSFVGVPLLIYLVTRRRTEQW